MSTSLGLLEYIPAAGHTWLTPLYDPLQHWLMRERTIKGRLVEQAAIKHGHHVLDLGCGTGTLALRIKRHHPGALVVGLDVDPRVLARARGKARSSSARAVSRLAPASTGNATDTRRHLGTATEAQPTVGSSIPTGPMGG
jgi:methylase of polypeptide subunit release factors